MSEGITGHWDNNGTIGVYGAMSVHRATDTIADENQAELERRLEEKRQWFHKLQDLQDRKYGTVIFTDLERERLGI